MMPSKPYSVRYDIRLLVRALILMVTCAAGLWLLPNAAHAQSGDVRVEAQMVEAVQDEMSRTATQGAEIRNLIATEGYLYFIANRGTINLPEYGVWRSDGTADGTEEVIPLGANLGANVNSGDLFAHGALVYVVITGETKQLIRFNGAQTEKLGTIDNYQSLSAVFGADGTLYFQEATQTTRHVRRVRPNSSAIETIFMVEQADWDVTVGIAATEARVYVWRVKDGVYSLYSSTHQASSLTKVSDLPAGQVPRGHVAFGDNLLFYTSKAIDPIGLLETIDSFYISDGSPSADLQVTLPISTENKVVGLAGSDDAAFLLIDGIPSATSKFWRTDGTDAGTQLVKEWEIGHPSLLVRPFRVVEGTMYITLLGENGYQAWASDGTISNTVPAAYPPNETTYWYVGHRLVYERRPAGGGHELWVIDDGQEFQLKEIGPGNSPYHGAARTQDVVMDGVLYFVGNDGAHGDELWRTDGTRRGTHLVRDVNTLPLHNAPNTPGPSIRAVTATSVYVTANTGFGEDILWRVDRKTFKVTPVVPDAAEMDFKSAIWRGPTNFVVDGEILYFTMQDPLVGERFLWRTDGTEAGARMILPEEDGPKWYNPTPRTVYQGKLYFVADDSLPTVTTRGKIFLWRTDGSAAGTEAVVEITSSPLSLDLENFDLEVVNDKLVLMGWFSTTPNVGSRRLGVWRLNQDGTDFTPVFDLQPFWQSPGPVPQYIPTLHLFDGYALFPFYSKEEGHELWRTDGTPEGTFLPKDMIPGKSGLGHVLTPFGSGFVRGETVNYIFGALTSDATVMELWRADGTRDGTRALHTFDLDELVGDTTVIRSPAVLGNDLYFLLVSPYKPAELWRSDGTEAGTRKLVDLATQEELEQEEVPVWSSGRIVAGDGVVYITEVKGEQMRLWCNDGTVQGARVLETYPVRSGGQGNGVVLTMNQTLFFQAAGVNVGVELFGYRQGETFLVGDIFAGSGDSEPRDYARAGDLLYFTAADEVYGRELFVFGNPPLLEDISLYLPTVQRKGAPELGCG